MAPITFRCPATRLSVQGWLADDPPVTEGEVYETVTCLACTRLHLIIERPAGCWVMTNNWTRGRAGSGDPIQHSLAAAKGPPGRAKPAVPRNEAASLWRSTFRPSGKAPAIRP
jgi:hypothetical protein